MPHPPQNLSEKSVSGGERKLLGRWGEAQAADYLRGRGYRIIDAGWRCRFGEIDLIAENEKYICFTEVKLRKNDHFAPARAFVNEKKQMRLRISAELYLTEYAGRLQPRFDVIEIYAPFGTATKEPDIRLIENAFE